MPPVNEIEEGDGKVAKTNDAGLFQRVEDATDTPTCSSYFDWWYRSSTEWVLWYVIAAKQPDVIDPRPSPSRIDSGIALSSPGYQHRTLQATPPNPLTLTFHLDDRTYTKTLDYHAFVRWEGVGALLDELCEDGILVNQLWDVEEDMEVGSGDWEARVRPGWNVNVWCSQSEWTPDCVSNFDSDDSDEEEDEDECESKGSIQRISDAVQCERRWWFGRWKERVERETNRRGKAQRDPSWTMILIWATSMVVFVAIVSVLAA